MKCFKNSDTTFRSNVLHFYYIVLCFMWRVRLLYSMVCYPNVMPYCALLCYVMLCYVMLCYVMLCYVMLCYVVLCCVVLCCVMLCSLCDLCYAKLYCTKHINTLCHCSHWPALFSHSIFSCQMYDVITFTLVSWFPARAKWKTREFSLCVWNFCNPKLNPFKNVKIVPCYTIRFSRFSHFVKV